MLSPDEVYKELLERGCVLRSGASKMDIEKLQDSIGTELPTYFKEIYTLFDGFADNLADQLSQIRIWSIDESLDFKLNSNLASEFIIFGDRLFGSDFLSINFFADIVPVFLLEANDKIADSYELFWFKFLNSEYDINY